jgi:hypothetical protein
MVIIAMQNNSNESENEKMLENEKISEDFVWFGAL